MSMLAVGLCGTDVQIGAGHRGDVAGVLGHEGVGILHGVPGGDRMVAFNPVDVRDQDSILGHSFDGLFRSWVPLGPELPPSALQEVQPLDPMAVLTLCEPLGTVLYSWELIERSAPAGPLSVGIWGAGPIGLLHVRRAIGQGHDVELVEARPERLAWVENHSRLAPVHLSVTGHRTPRPLDVAIICAPRPAMASAVREAADALRPDGTMVLVTALDAAAAAPTFVDATVGRVRRHNVCGNVDPELGMVTAVSHEGKPLVLTGHRGTSLAQLHAAESVLRADPGGYGALITHELSPEDAVDVINRRLDGQFQTADGSEIVKVVVHFTDGGRHG
ncbi:dehydrogenase [Kitasatospora sp. GP82]|uniref:dehydrogenase n=1 Tax=Kitasatospora sp. GP82 TaxID=3035089 RepID=UPI0024730DC3|nr:dehydrogenase [Kitasatospora sp. GP82]